MDLLCGGIVWGRHRAPCRVSFHGAERDLLFLAAVPFWCAAVCIWVRQCAVRRKHPVYLSWDKKGGNGLMWIIYGSASILFLLLHWVFAAKESPKRAWAMACSFVFTILTLWAEYRLIWGWVMQKDWSALGDVVPSMLTPITLYALLMAAGNLFPLCFGKRPS